MPAASVDGNGDGGEKMIGRIPARIARLGAAIFATTAVFAVAAGAASAAPEVIYNDMPSPLGPNVVSVGFEAEGDSSFGGIVEFGETARKKPVVTVAMSSWACQSGQWQEKNCSTQMGAKFEWPIKWGIYTVGPGNTLGTLLGGGLTRFAMPYRPSASPKCTGAEAGKWFSKGECFNGKAFKLVLPVNLPVKTITLPSTAIILISYNTSDYGATKQRPKPCNSEPQGCPYDSLNVGVQDGFSTPAGTPPSPGAWPEPDVAIVNGAPESGWTGFQPLFTVKAS
jgi:hypothetical protein